MRSKRRGLLVTAMAAGLLVLGMSPAWAHVSIEPEEATQGGFAKITLRVPNETENANTTQLDVQIPSDPPFASVSVQPKAGWTADVKKTPLPTPVTDDDGNSVTEAVSEIIWSGGQIRPGEFDEFSISVGPLPDVDSLTFKAIQTYDDGTEVKWIDPVVEGQPEPDHPAPVLHLTAVSAGSDSHNGSSSSSSSTDTPTAGTATVVKKETDNGLAIAALVVAAVALVVGGAGWIRRRT